MNMILHNTVSIVIEKDGRFLLVKRANPPERNYWAVPGGHRDKGETLHETAKREAREEVGQVEITSRKPVLVFVHDVKIGHRHTSHIFPGRVSGKLEAKSDAKKLGWFTLQQMKRMNITHYTKKILNSLYEKSL